MKDHLIKPVKASETHLLRQKILRPNQSINEMKYPGDEDGSTIHYGLIIDKVISGIASVYFEKMPGGSTDNSYRLRGMAVDEKIRGEGFGKIILEYLISDLKKKNAVILWCNARTTAAGFYKKSGFNIVGDEFELPGIGPHYLMRLDL